MSLYTREQYDALFSVFAGVNDYLMDKQAKHNVNFNECYAFQATSFSLSLIRNRSFHNSKSLHRCYILRCLTECLAVWMKYLDGGFGKIDNDLLNGFGYIAEYKIYKRYKDKFKVKHFDFDQISKNYFETVKTYKEKLQLKDTREVNKIFKNSMPYLNEKYDFKTIIDEYLPDLSDCYKYFSVFSHPVLMDVAYNLLDDLDLDEVEECLITYTYLLLEHTHLNTYLCNKTITLETKLLLNESPMGSVKKFANEQNNILRKIGSCIEAKMGRSNESCLFYELGDLLNSLAIDACFASGEIVKCKIKMLLDNLSFNMYLAQASKLPKDFWKIKYATLQIQSYMAYIIGDNYEERLDRAYKLYCEHNKIIEKSEFKTNFLKPLSFIGKNEKLKDLVYKAIEDSSKDNQEIINTIKLNYDESIYLSHGNGYMLLANAGAFNDYFPAFVSIESMINFYINLYIANWIICVDLEEDKETCKFVDELKKLNEEFNQYCYKIYKIEVELSKYKIPYEI